MAGRNKSRRREVHGLAHVGRHMSLTAARHLLEALEAEGIPAKVEADPGCSGFGYRNVVGRRASSAEVYVRKADYERAAVLLTELRAKETPQEEHADVDGPPVVGLRTVARHMSPNAVIAFFLVMLLVVFLALLFVH